MSRKTRLIYFYLAILIFIASGAGVIYYANGWRFEFDNYTFAKVAALTVQSDPRGADIYLKNIKYKTTTPSTIRNLRPGEIPISIKKNGYYDWAKTVSIESGTAYQFNSIILLKNQELLEPLLPAHFQTILISASNKYISGLNDSELKVFDINTLQLIYSKKYAGRITTASWSPISDNILTETADKQFVEFNPLLASEEINLSEFIDNPIISAHWSDTEGNIIYAYTDQAVYRINIFQKTVTLLTSDPGTGFITENYFFSTTENELNISQNSNLIQKIALHVNHHLEFRKLSSEWVSIIDINNYQMWLFNIKTNDMKSFTQEVVATPSLNNDQLLYHNKFEIWSYNLNLSEASLIIRSSDQITSAAILVPNNYIIYAKQANGLNILGYSSTNTNSYQVSLTDVSQINILGGKGNVLVVSAGKPYLLHF